MTDEPVDLDKHRQSVAQKSVRDFGQQLQDLQADQAGLRQRQDELETLFIASPAESWPEAASKVRYLLQLFADMPEVLTPRRRQLIAHTLDDVQRLCDQTGKRS